MDDEPIITVKPVLLAMHEDVTPSEYYLDDVVCTIGRAPGCRILIQGAQISRLHARIEPVEGARYVLSDAGSVNGTYVNGRRVTGSHILRHDDIIGLGAPTPLLRFLDADATVYSSGTLTYDERTMVFRLQTTPLDLTMTQFRLLSHLYRNVGSVCSRESCAQALWGRDYEPGLDAGALDQAFNSLRRVLRDADPEHGGDLIQTRRGLGYELVL